MAERTLREHLEALAFWANCFDYKNFAGPKPLYGGRDGLDAAEHAIVPALEAIDAAGITNPAALPEAIEAMREAYKHVEELREAWRTGAITEHDGFGGTRSNRNVEVEVALRAALAALTGDQR